MRPTSEPRRERSALSDAIERWGLVLDGPPTPTGSVVFARRAADDQPVVVKIGPPGSEAALGMAALRLFRAQGCIALLDSANGVALLDRARPGRPLTELVLTDRDDEATAQLCAVARTLHRAAPAAEAIADELFPSMEDWGGGFARYQRSGDAIVPAPLVDRARAIFDELAVSQGARRLLHGDLHHDNVLWDDGRGWLAIDPKGVLGELAYDLGAALRNPVSAPTRVASSAVAERRSRIIAEQLGLDRRRVLLWAFAQAVLAAVWAREEGQSADWALAAAGALRRAC